MQCKSIGCDNEISQLGTDFCAQCNYVHSIFGTEPEQVETSEVEYGYPIEIPLDTYAVHNAFNIQDPSGCLQRASRIILLTGQMNEDESGMPKAADVMEARTMLTRWLQLNEYE